MNVRIFKLVDGSELIGKCKYIRDRNNSDVYVIDDPLEVKYRVDITGAASAVMTKYNYFGDEKVIKLNATGVITHYLVSEKYVKIYEDALVDALKEINEAETKTKTSAESIKSLIPKIISGNNTVH